MYPNEIKHIIQTLNTKKKKKGRTLYYTLPTFQNDNVITAAFEDDTASLAMGKNNIKASNKLHTPN